MNRSRVQPGETSRRTIGAPGRVRHGYQAPLATAIAAILATTAAHAQKADVGALDEVVVTAQKRAENMQDVPVAIVAFGTEKLEEMHIQNLDDYVKYLPSIAISRGDGQGSNGQPGVSHIYMRGVVSTPNENHSGSQPSVGMYLDEQPVTTIDGNLDIHVYDIARVEVLEGPQGTLYGASSEAGTVRIITNKPDPTKFEAGYNLTANSVSHGGIGYGAEGFVNLPLSPVAAIRLVGWDEHSAGFINNVAGTNLAAGIQDGNRYFPTWCSYNHPGVTPSNATCPVGSGSISNAAYVKDHYNTADTKGGRAALKLDLGDNWTVTPTVMGQSTTSEGFFGYDPAVGDLEVVHFGPENSQEAWAQGALTVEGKFSNFDVVYASAFLKRTTHSIADYADYSFFYDSLAGSGCNWVGKSASTHATPGCSSGSLSSTNAPIMPQELVYTKGYFQKWSHELRMTTPQEYPVKATFGAFIERQTHDIFEQYIMPGYGFSDPFAQNPNGFDQDYSIPALNNTIWLTDEQRVDRDRAVFAQATWDINTQWSATFGMRKFWYDNGLQGYFGYSPAFGGNHCVPGGPTTDPAQPCSDLNQRATGDGSVPRVNVTFKVTPDKLLYATYSKGFRPGGVNRVGGGEPYQPDFLKNYELGWKTQWLNRHVRWNGSLFWEDWNNFQWSFLVPPSITEIKNGGSARIKGVESSLDWAMTGGLTVSWNFQLMQARTTTTTCHGTAPDGSAVTSGDCSYTYNGVTGSAGPVDAASGTELPVSPKFKTNLVLRQNFPLSGDWDGSAQVAFVYQSEVSPDLRPAWVAEVGGMQPAYAMTDLTFGAEKNGMRAELFVTNLTDKRGEVSRFVQSNQSQQPYVIPTQPRTIGIKFGQKF